MQKGYILFIFFFFIKKKSNRIAFLFDAFYVELIHKAIII